MKKSKYPELRAEMVRHGDTQSAIANLINITVTSICRRLSGEIDWKISEIEKICKHYGKSYDELFKKVD